MDGRLGELAVVVGSFQAIIIATVMVMKEHLYLTSGSGMDN
jgi:hypothetical protein